jgi:hypothetical protein
MRQSRRFREYSAPSNPVLLKSSLSPTDVFKTNIRGNTHSQPGQNHILGKTAIICPLETGLEQQLRSSNYVYNLCSICVQDLI